MVAGLGKLSYLSVHLFCIGVGASKRGMSEEVPELVSALLSASESIRTPVSNQLAIYLDAKNSSKELNEVMHSWHTVLE